MENPFAILERRLNRLEHLLIEIRDNQSSLNPDENQDQWFDLDGVCNYIPGKPAKSTVYSMVSRREMPATKKAGRLMFRKSEIDAWLATGRRKTVEEIKKEVLQ